MKLALKVTPNARKNECLGWEDNPLAGRVLKLRIAAPPVEGKANKEIISYLSKLLGIPKSSLEFFRGETGRLKIVEIPDTAGKTLEQLEFPK